MSNGQLRCVGSPLFLNKAYGVGYQLTIEKKVSRRRHVEEKKTEELIDGNNTATPNGREVDLILKKIVKSAVPEATRLSNTSTEMSYQLPIGAASRFAPMFARLDEEVDTGTLFSYGISVSTLVRTFHIAVFRRRQF